MPQYENAKTSYHNKVNKNKPGRKLDHNKILEARKLRAQGMTVEEIGKKLNRDKSTISRWLKRDDLPYDFSKVNTE